MGALIGLKDDAVIAFRKEFYRENVGGLLLIMYQWNSVTFKEV
jgi:hypothetical protein